MDSLKKLSVLLPSGLHMKAKRYCVDHDITLTELVTHLLQTFLAKNADGNDPLP